MKKCEGRNGRCTYNASFSLSVKDEKILSCGEHLKYFTRNLVSRKGNPVVVEWI